MKAFVVARMAAFLVTGFAVAFARADEATASPDAPATAPATQPAAHITDDARQLIAQVGDAYAGLKALQLAGTITADLQIEGSAPGNHVAELTASFVAPNQFRHEVKGDVLVGGTGQKIYTFQAGENTYTLADGPKERVASKDLPKPVPGLLEMQDPSLLLALAKNPAEELTRDVTDAGKADDTKIGDAAFPTLKLVQSDKSVERIAVDPQTHLLRQMTVDLTPVLRQRRPDLARAVVTVDYTTVTADAPAKDESFAWSPPPGSKDGAAMAAAEGNEPPVPDLEGKAAPDFRLNGLGGKAVALADFKGKVVVLDFWATWCPPCRMSLPHLNELYNAKKDAGLQLFAIDEQEDKGDVEEFVKQTKLSIPVLLDTEGKAGEQYGATGLPQTVVIGKDGKVKKVFVGFDPDKSPAELQKLVEAAMKE